MLVATANHGLYDALVGAHVVAAVVGFGSVAVSGVYGATARSPSRAETLEEVRRYFRGRGWAEYLLLTVPFFGLAALSVRPGHHSYSYVWVIAGEAIWVAAVALLLFVVRPAERAVRHAAGSSRPAAARGPGSRLLWASIGSNVLFVVALGFMVTQPR